MRKRLTPVIYYILNLLTKFPPLIKFHDHFQYFTNSPTDRKDLQLKRAKQDKLNLQTEVEELQSKVERINSMAKQVFLFAQISLNSLDYEE